MYLAILKVENNRVAKFMEFEELYEAAEHAKRHGGFVHETMAPVNHLWVEGQQVSVSPPVETREPSELEVIKEAIGRDNLEAARARLRRG